MSRQDDPFDPTDDRLRPLAEYTDRLPSRCRGRKLNRATLWRWALHGVRGGKVRLATWLLGGGRFTSDEAVAAFMEERAFAGTPEKPSAMDIISEQRRAAIRKRFGPGRKS